MIFPGHSLDLIPRVCLTYFKCIDAIYQVIVNECCGSGHWVNCPMNGVWLTSRFRSYTSIDILVSFPFFVGAAGVIVDQSSFIK